MDKQALKKTVLEYIRKENDVSYAELQWLFDRQGFDYRGEFEIFSPVNENVVFWTGWNREAIDILNELKSENLIEQEPAQLLVYLIDGAGPSLPLVRKAANYKTPHWLPLVFLPVKGASSDGR
ncbi:hypothetical protein CAFE_30800 [Caprobacter fermentans]|uniref:Pathogenicity island protein n=1 Tax=Caproicibacter fermentans TaxID=2576756 RepID=A0A6N8I2J0_9FIRM|nr:hypothetical protein [Caproicibacter fermentans]MVB12346.1 hypothetical protein [Caproicibacter fermentans]